MSLRVVCSTALTISLSYWQFPLCKVVPRCCCVDQLLSLPSCSLNRTDSHPCCAYRNDSNELVGYCELYRLPHIGRNFDSRIERVVVREAFRGRGLATLMCEHLIQQVRYEKYNTSQHTVLDLMNDFRLRNV